MDLFLFPQSDMQSCASALLSFQSRLLLESKADHLCEIPPPSAAHLSCHIYSYFFSYPQAAPKYAGTVFSPLFSLFLYNKLQ